MLYRKALSVNTLVQWNNNFLDSASKAINKKVIGSFCDQVVVFMKKEITWNVKYVTCVHN